MSLIRMSHICVPWHVCDGNADPGKTDLLACPCNDTKYAQS